MSGLSRSGYSAKRECGRGHPDQRNEEAEPRESQKDDLLPPLAILYDFDARDSAGPCGARMATITMLAARITAFAIHGFIVDDSSPVTTHG